MMQITSILTTAGIPSPSEALLAHAMAYGDYLGSSTCTIQTKLDLTAVPSVAYYLSLTT